MAISVTEKEHWKNSITSRIDKKIAAIKLEHKPLFDEIVKEAEAQALQELGIKEDFEKLLKIEAEQGSIEKRQKAALQRVIDKLLPGEPACYYGRVRITSEIDSARRKLENVLILSHEVGHQIARLEREKENLLDTIWLATSSRQATRLWQGLVALLGEEATEFQKDILLGKNQVMKE